MEKKEMFKLKEKFDLFDKEIPQEKQELMDALQDVRVWKNLCKKHSCEERRGRLKVAEARLTVAVSKYKRYCQENNISFNYEL